MPLKGSIINLSLQTNVNNSTYHAMTVTTTTKFMQKCDSLSSVDASDDFNKKQQLFISHAVVIYVKQPIRPSNITHM